MLIDDSIKDMSDSLSNYNILMQKTNIGKKFRWASDDVSNAVSSLTIRSTLEKQSAYLETANANKLWMDATESAVRAMEDLATRSINLTMEGLSDTMGPAQRETVGRELDMILTQAIGVGNTRHLDKYIFSGFQTDTRAFERVAGTYPVPPGTPDTVVYYGDNGNITRNIGPQQSIVVNLGGDVFNGSGHDIFSAIIRARDAMNNNNRTEAEAGLKDIQDALAYMSNKVTEYGGRERELQANIENMEQTEIGLRSLLSTKEDVNMADAISSLKQQENVYQTVLQVSSRTINLMSLFDRIS
jgi:flagellar hook-associated protein 3 FlgL